MRLRTIVLAAALMHLALALAIFVAARKQIAPRLIARDGIMTSVGVDSLRHRDGAVDLVGVLHKQGFKAWARQPYPPHVHIISLCFAILGSRVGITTLAAEPYNLVCYLAVVILAFAIARELGGEGSARAAAIVVALWPTFLLHTTQFLKDAMFVAGALVLVLLVVTWLTRTYGPRETVAAALVAAVVTVVLVVIRDKFVIVVLVLAALGLLLLAARAIAERRFLRWNLICAVAIVAAVGALTVRQSPRLLVKNKSYPAARRGESKAASTYYVVTTTTKWVASSEGGLDKAALMLGSVRLRYNAGDANSGSRIDDAVELHRARDVVDYLPRAFALGMWSPYPTMWLRSGQTVGKAGRLLSGGETLVTYVFQLLAIVGIILPPRRLPALLLLVITAFGVTMIGLVVSNVGTIYRFRYTFWILLIIAGISGATKLAARLRGRAMATAAVAALLAASCAQHHAAAGKSITVTNLTGYTIDALFLSPAGTASWEENVLDHDVLLDGGTVEIDLPIRPLPPRWDLCVQGSGYRAEWRGFEIEKVAGIDVLWGNRAVVAQLEHR